MSSIKRVRLVLQNPANQVWAWVILAAGLWITAAWAGWPYLLRPWALFQLNYNEGWNAYRAQEALQHRLYILKPAFSVTNYPPLSFYLIGHIGIITGNPVMAGRLVSIASLAMICVAITFILRSMRVPVAGCIAGAALFVVMLESYGASYIGVDDPQLLGMSFAAFGLCCVLWRLGPAQGAIASAFLFSAALFTKHNLIALPIGVGLAMVQEREWKKLFIWAGMGAICGVTLYLTTRLLDGPYFFSNLLCSRAYSFEKIETSLMRYCTMFFPFLVMSLIWSCKNLFTRGGRNILALVWFPALCVGTILSGGDGVSRNIMFESMLLDAVIVILACHDLFCGQFTVRAPGIMLLLVPFLAVPIFHLISSKQSAILEWREAPRLQAQFAAGVDILKASSGPVVCENLLMCFDADRNSTFDPYFVMDQIKAGKMQDSEITDLVTHRNLSAVEIGDTNLPARQNPIRFTKSFMAALYDNYQLMIQTPQFSIWVPRQAPQQ